MVTTSTSAIGSTTSITNNSNMLLYNNNGTSPSVSERAEGNSISVGSIASCNASTTLEQYRLQLYNYALNMERLRGPPYTAAAAMAAAAAYASTTTVSTTTINCPPAHGTNYTGSGQGTTAPPTPSTYLTGNLIAATSHMGRNPSAINQCPTNNRLALASMSLFSQPIFQPEEPKPQHSYIGLIAMAILSSAERKLVLSDIYQYILDNYPYFRTRGPGWRNSIRHNLSLNDCFIKSGRSANGKGHYWAIHPANMEDFRKGDFRRRKAQRKVRKHMGLAVDDNGTDSPSPPPAMDLTSPSPPSFQHIVMGSSTITPLATAAQHLAAQSFGWRFTQHHRQHQQHHHHQQQTGSHSAASYMGQIFTYRPQHYAAAAAAAAALCHTGSTQQPQQLIAQNSHHQLHQPSLVQPTTDSSLQQQSLLLSSQSSIATNVQVNVINELFSQKRKRQFDVASLLAPDNLNRREREREQQIQYIRNHTISESETDDVRHSPCNEDVDVNTSAVQTDIEIEDIDVVEASEDEDIEADYEQDDDDDDEEADSNCNSHSPAHSPVRDDDETDYIPNYESDHRLSVNPNHCKISKLKMSTDEEEIMVYRTRQYETNVDNVDDDPDDHVEGDNNNNQSEDSYNNVEHKNSSITSIANTLSSSTTITSTPPPPSSTHLLNASKFLEQNNDLHHQSNHQHPNHSLPLNADAHHLFGHYYGSYMAAAAARINSSIPPANMVGNTD